MGDVVFVTKDVISNAVNREGGVFEYIYYHQVNAVHLPDDAPADVKCAWMHLYNQGLEDVKIIKRWLEDESAD